MEIKEFLSEERAVSPVIGVILMVAITVILAAVIGTFVLGLGQNVNSTPQASFGFDFDSTNDSTGNGSVTVTHEGGDELNSDNTDQVSINDTGNDYSSTVGLPISAGTSKTISYDSGDTVRVVWVGLEGDSATLASQDAPS